MTSVDFFVKGFLFWRMLTF